MVGGEQRRRVPGQRRRQLDPARGPVLAALQADRLLQLSCRAVDPVEAAATLAAGQALLDHAIEQRHLAQQRPERVVGRQRRLHAGVDVRHQVEPDQVDQTEHAGLRDAERAPHRGVGLLHGEAAIHRLQQAALQPEGADAVGDEARRVVRPHHALAEAMVAERLQPRQQRRIGVRPGHHLEQAHVARRVEEVGDQEVARQRLGQPLDQQRARDRRGVGADHGAGTAMRLQRAVQRLLDVEPLHHRLDDPVALGDAGEVVVDAAGLDQPRRGGRHERRRVGLERARHRVARQLVARAVLLRRDVQQQHRRAGVGDLGGDRRPHDAGADHAGLADGGVRAGGHHARSRTVAMPWPPPMHCVASA